MILDGDGLLHYANAAVPGSSVSARKTSWRPPTLGLFPEGNLGSIIGDTLPQLLETGSWEGEITCRSVDGREIPVLQIGAGPLRRDR